MSTRAERVEQAQALWADGVSQREIAERMGLAPQTVHDLIRDPDLAKARARKARRFGLCCDCGARVTNSGSEPPKRCVSCARAWQGTMEARRNKSKSLCGSVHWTNEEVLSLVRALAVNGRLTKPMWEAAHAADPQSVPSFNTVVRRWNTWSELCAEAGVTAARTPGPYRNRTPKAECIRWLQRCADEQGRIPTHEGYQDWHLAREGSPSAQTIRNRLGSWMAACEFVVVSGDDLREAA